jgi:hypothetical protein
MKLNGLKRQYSENNYSLEYGELKMKRDHAPDTIWHCTRLHITSITHREYTPLELEGAGQFHEIQDIKIKFVAHGYDPEATNYFVSADKINGDDVILHFKLEDKEFVCKCYVAEYSYIVAKRKMVVWFATRVADNNVDWELHEVLKKIGESTEEIVLC